MGVDFENPGHPHEGEPIDVFWDGRRLPFDDSSFDSILSTEVFEHVFDLPGTLRELARVLRPGGWFLCTCPFAWELHEEPVDFARYTPHALRSLLHTAGLEVAEAVQTGSYTRALGQLKARLATRILFGWFGVSRPVRALARVWWWLINVRTLAIDRLLSKERSLFLSNVVLARRLAGVAGRSQP